MSGSWTNSLLGSRRTRESCMTVSFNLVKAERSKLATRTFELLVTQRLRKKLTMAIACEAPYSCAQQAKILEAKVQLSISWNGHARVNAMSHEAPFSAGDTADQTILLSHMIYEIEHAPISASLARELRMGGV